MGEPSAEIVIRRAPAPNGNGAHYGNGRQPNGAPGSLRAVLTDGRKHTPSPVEDAPEVAALADAMRYGRRSLGMQLRYLRTLLFSAWVFVRVIFWYVYVQRIFGSDFVMHGHEARMRQYAREFRKFAIALGGMHIKLGQFISTRIDVLPEAVINELVSLQDEVPAVPYLTIRRVIEEELGPIEQRYRRFNPTPVAAASLGQVYRAELLNGDRVVIKVQRPGIREVCYTDLAALRVVARVAMSVRFIARRADVPALAEEFGHVLLQELSYKHEARNAARFAHIFEHDHGIYIPTIYEQHSTDTVLTIEDVTAVKINDFEALEAAGINRKEVAKRLMDAYLKQVFNEHFFHADPHPGNLFVYPLPVDDPATADFGAQGRPFYLIFIDFGMTGTLSPKIANGMVATLAAVLERNPRKLVQGYKQLGLLLPEADVERIEEATEAAFQQVWGLSMSELKDIDYNTVAEIGKEFNDLIRSMPFYLPQDFIYLGRAIGILSGMCTTLDPNYNPWQELQPYAQRLMAQGLGVMVSETGALTPATVLQSLFNGNGADALLRMGQTFFDRSINAPARAGLILERLERGDLRLMVEPAAEFKRRLANVELQSRITARAVVFGSVLITATLFYVNGHWVAALLGYGLTGLAYLALWQGE